MAQYVRESELPIDQQFANLCEAFYGFKLRKMTDSIAELEWELVDTEMVVRLLDKCQPLRAQVVAELRRVSRVYADLADRAEQEGLDEDGQELQWTAPIEQEAA